MSPSENLPKNLLRSPFFFNIPKASPRVTTSPQPRRQPCSAPAMSEDRGESQSIRVYARVRPSRAPSSRACVSADPRSSTITLHPPDAAPQTFTFDAAGGPSTSQEDVYAAVGRDVVDAVLSGYNACVFAYGQTASGKSHTIMGECGCCDVSGGYTLSKRTRTHPPPPPPPSPGPTDASAPETERGVLPRVVEDLWQRMSAAESAPGAEVQFSCSASYFEVRRACSRGWWR